MKVKFNIENDFKDNKEFEGLPKVFTFIDLYIRWSDKTFVVGFHILGMGVSLGFEKEGENDQKNRID